MWPNRAKNRTKEPFTRVMSRNTFTRITSYLPAMTGKADAAALQLTICLRGVFGAEFVDKV